MIQKQTIAILEQITGDNPKILCGKDKVSLPLSRWSIVYYDKGQYKRGTSHATSGNLDLVRAVCLL